jgi:hypothetical protein
MRDTNETRRALASPTGTTGGRIKFDPNRPRLSRFAMLARPARCIAFRLHPEEGIKVLNKDTVRLRPADRDFDPIQHFLKGYVELPCPGLGDQVEKDLEGLQQHGGDIQLVLGDGGTVIRGSVKVRGNPPGGETEPFLTVETMDSTAEPPEPVSICPCDVGLDEDEG